MRRKKIKDATITMISLCKRGRNRMPVIYKAEGDSLDIQPLLKAADRFDEMGEILAVIYPPNLPDTDGHFADADGIKQMAHSFAKSGGALDIEHDQKKLPRESIFVAESFLIQKGDPRFEDWKDLNDKPVDVAGGWGAVIKVEDPALRKLYREQGWNGVSMFGRAELVPVEKSESGDEKVDAVVASMLKRLNIKPRVSIFGDYEMDPKEFAALMKSNNEALIAGISEAVAKALKPEDKKPIQKSAVDVPFEGDFTNPADVQAHATKVALAKSAAEVDYSDPVSVGKYLTLLKAHAPKTDAAAALKKAEDDLKAQQATVEKLRKASNVDPANDGDPSKPNYEDFAKSILAHANG